MNIKENIGKIISEARKNKKITQLELAKLINVSDKAISNWETEKNIPDIDTIKKLEKILNIELLEQKKTKKDIIKKRIAIVLGVLIILLLIFTSIYFINNFNKVKIYEITLDSENFKINNSNLIITNNQIVLNLNEIINLEELKNQEYTLTLYYKEKDEIHNIITKPDYHSISINENKNNYHFLSKEFIKNIDNLYINIKYEDSNNNECEEDIKIQISKTFQNNKLIYIKEKEEKDEYKNLRIILKNNNYKEVDYNIYEKNLKNEKFRYDLINSILYYAKSEKDTDIHASFNIYGYNNEIKYDVFKNNKLIEKYDYNNLENYYQEKKYYYEIYNNITKEAQKLLED